MCETPLVSTPVARISKNDAFLNTIIVVDAIIAIAGSLCFSTGSDSGSGNLIGCGDLVEIYRFRARIAQWWLWSVRFGDEILDLGS